MSLVWMDVGFVCGGIDGGMLVVWSMFMLRFLIGDI